MYSCFWKARFCYCKVFWLPVYVLGSFQPFWFWLYCLRMSWFSTLLGLWFSLPLHWRSGYDLLWVYDRFVKYVRRQVPRKKASFMRCEFIVFENAADPLPSGRPPSSLDSNLFRSSTDPLLMYSTSSCCVNVFVASYFVYWRAGWARFPPPPYPSIVCDVSCGFC